MVGWLRLSDDQVNLTPVAETSSVNELRLVWKKDIVGGFGDRNPELIEVADILLPRQEHPLVRDRVVGDGATPFEQVPRSRCSRHLVQTIDWR